MRQDPKQSSLIRAFARGYFPHELSWLIDNPFRRLLITPETFADRLAISESSWILEIGPGSGYFSVELARRAPRGRLELFDVQVEMLAKVRRKLEARGFRNVGFTQGNARSGLPYPEAQFDLAVLVTVLGEVPNKDVCIESLYRVLRQGAMLAIHEHLPDPDFISFTRLRSVVEKHGFAFQRRWGYWWNYTASFERR
jgi:ubiquinone/menaquinone biosynthesis C-methylase UbiE